LSSRGAAAAAPSSGLGSGSRLALSLRWLWLSRDAIPGARMARWKASLASCSRSPTSLGFPFPVSLVMLNEEQGEEGGINASGFAEAVELDWIGLVLTEGRGKKE
jgi:hypothetical protein